MNDYSELDVRHHDFKAKWRSVTAALATDLGDDATRAAIDAVRLLRTPMWRQGMWRAFERDVDRALAAAAKAGLHRERDELLAYKIGVNEALGKWPEVFEMAREAMRSARSPAMIGAAAFRLGTALHYLGRPCEGAKMLARAATVLRHPDELIEVRHKYHRMLRAVLRPKAAGRLLERLIGEADEWLRAEMLLDTASLVAKSQPERALACIVDARRIYTDGAFGRGLAYADLEEGLLRLRLGEAAAASILIVRAETAFTEERYRPGQAQAAFARGLLAREGRNRAQASADFHSSMIEAWDIRYVNAAARAALLGLPLHLRARHVGRAWRAVRILGKASLVRAVDLLRHGLPASDVT